MKIIKIVGLSFCLMGCSIGASPDDPRFAPVIPDMADMPKPAHGSLFNQSYQLALYEDRKAHQVGDIITVMLVEKTQAKKDAKTHLKKNDAAAISNPTVLGTSFDFGLPKMGHYNPLKTRHHLNFDSSLSGSRQFTGEADSNQSNELQGGITVTVAQILPNKNLLVRGEKWITLNQGSEFIRVSGIVRPEDIAPDNSVQSTRIANARITYTGTGSLSNSNKPGWLSKFFNSGWMPL